MQITATILNADGSVYASSVSITSININGSTIYISYVDGSNNLKAIKQFLTSAGQIYASGCTIVS